MMFTPLSLLYCVLALFPLLAIGSDVVVLNRDNFDEIIDGSKAALVEFYAPWCGHCKTLAPVYEELASAFAGHKQQLVIAKVDADNKENSELARKFGVQGYPTLKWFPKGSLKPKEYDSGRTLEDLTAFITKHTNLKPAGSKGSHSYTTVLTKENFNELVNSPKVNILVEFYAPWCGHCKSLAPIYEKVAETYSPEGERCIVAKVDATAEAEAVEKYGITGYPTIKFFSRDNKEGIDYDGQRTEEGFVSFLNEHCGTHRKVGGGLTEKAGRDDSLDKIVKEFMTDESKKAQVLAEAERIIKEKETESPDSKLYLRFMQKVEKNGKDYVKKELKRLQGIISQKDQVSRQKLDSFYIRHNILRSFDEL